MKQTILFDLEGTLVDVAGESLSRVFVAEADLSVLSKKYCMGIVTGATRGQLEYVLTQTFLKKYFNITNTVTVDDCSEPKASGGPFRYFIQSNSASKYVIVGDSKGDALGAQKLGVPFVHVSTSELLAGTSFSNYLIQAQALLE